MEGAFAQPLHALRHAGPSGASGRPDSATRTAGSVPASGAVESPSAAVGLPAASATTRELAVPAVRDWRTTRPSTTVARAPTSDCVTTWATSSAVAAVMSWKSVARKVTVCGPAPSTSTVRESPAFNA